MTARLDDTALDRLFREARTASAWTDEPVEEAVIREVYALAALGPTANNSTPARYLFLPKGEARDRLVPLMSEGNRAKTAGAPWTVLIAHDRGFAETMPLLNPGTDPERFRKRAEDEAWLSEHLLRNGTLGSAYLLLAARALGLDCGPMSGFDAGGVDRAFFLSDPASVTWRINWICNLGHAQPPRQPRKPRLSFEQACAILR